MISGFVAQKGKMTSIFDEKGNRVAVTICRAKPLTVTQVKNLEKDKYESIQVAFGSKKNIHSAVAGKLKKNKLDLKPSKFKEFKKTSTEEITVGTIISIDNVFSKDDSITITGTSKGKGYAGVIKRHGFKKQPIRGSSNYVRHPGAIGAQTPSKVVKGKKMPGHMGNITKTIKGIKVFSVNKDTNEILICGSIPGAINSWVTISKN